jgi:hypothetical protein
MSISIRDLLKTGSLAQIARFGRHGIHLDKTVSA